MTIFVIVLVYNGEKWIRNCLESILKQEYQNTFILAVDNASNDNSRRIIKEEYPQVMLIENNRNLGFAEGNNVGIRYALKAGAEYIALLNQDIIVTHGWLSNLMEASKKFPDFGIFSPVQYDYKGEKIDPIFANILNLDRDSENIIIDAKLREIYEVPYVSGASLFIKKEVFEKIGLFDPIYFMYHEEADFFQRAKFHGIKTAIVSSSKIRHYHTHIHPDQMSIRTKLLSFRNYYLLKIKNPNSNLLKNIILSFYLNMSDSVKAFINKRNIKRIIISFYINFWLLVHLPVIIYKRYQEKIKPCYL